MNESWFRTPLQNGFRYEQHETSANIIQHPIGVRQYCITMLRQVLVTEQGVQSLQETYTGAVDQAEHKQQSPT